MGIGAKIVKMKLIGHFVMPAVLGLLLSSKCHAQTPLSAMGTYDQEVVTTDGPIIYGTGMSADDQQKAWKHFFYMMIEACGRQQGNETLGLKLAPRCQPEQDFCTITIDAKLTGLGGIQEPRQISVIVATDRNDNSKQLSRIVCTIPNAGTRVCREFNTGRLVTGQQ